MLERWDVRMSPAQHPNVLTSRLTSCELGCWNVGTLGCPPPNILTSQRPYFSSELGCWDVRTLGCPPPNIPTSQHPNVPTMPQIIFLTLFLGIVSGTQPLILEVTGPVKSVRVFLGGR